MSISRGARAAFLLDDQACSQREGERHDQAEQQFAHARARVEILPGKRLHDLQVPEHFFDVSGQSISMLSIPGRLPDYLF